MDIQMSEWKDNEEHPLSEYNKNEVVIIRLKDINQGEKHYDSITDTYYSVLLSPFRYKDGSCDTNWGAYIDSDIHSWCELPRLK